MGWQSIPTMVAWSKWDDWSAYAPLITVLLITSRNKPVSTAPNVLSVMNMCLARRFDLSGISGISGVSIKNQVPESQIPEKKTAALKPNGFNSTKTLRRLDVFNSLLWPLLDPKYLQENPNNTISNSDPMKGFAGLVPYPYDHSAISAPISVFPSDRDFNAA